MSAGTRTVDRGFDHSGGRLIFLNDAFDVVWRANDRNVRLLEARLTDPSGKRRDRWAVAVVGAAVFLTVLAVGLAGMVAA